MTANGKTSRGNALLWTALAMFGAALILVLVGTFYVGRSDAGRSGSYQGPGYGGYGFGNAPGLERGGRSADIQDVNSLSDARDAVERAVQSYGNPDLQVEEVMEFANNYYAEVKERDTDTLAMEMLVDKRTGQVYPEPGPNMMWNTKYGMMAGTGGMMGGGMMGSSSQSNSRQVTDEMPIGPDRATEIANNYLERVSPGTKTEKPDTFYGYYTLHTERDGKVTGMLSVNGYSGEVWYHSWHGAFIAMDEGDE